MAITSMNQLIVGMFNAPAGNLLAGLEFVYGDDFESAAADLVSAAAFPYASVNEMVAAMLGDSVDADTLAAADAWADTQTDMAAAALFAVDFLLTTEDEAYANARAQFENKVTVAAHYSTGENMVTFTDVATSQALIASVTSDAASVTAITEAPVVVEGSTFTLTTGDDTFVGTTGNDSYVATEANIEGDTDVIVDASSDDNDTLTITGTDFSNSLDLSGAIINNVENIVADVNSLTAVTVNTNGVNSATNFTVNQTRDGSGATVTVDNVFNGSTVNAGTGVNDLDVSTDTANHSVTVNGADATGTVAATVTGTGNATVTANSASQVTVVSAAGATASGTGGNVTVTGKTIDVTAGKKDSTVTLNGVGAEDTATVTSSASIAVDNNTAVETLKLSSDAESTFSLASNAATTYELMGAGDVTLKATSAFLTGKTITNSTTGTGNVEISDLTASSNLVKAATVSAITMSDAALGGTKTLTLADAATLNITKDLSHELTLTADDTVATTYLAGSVTVNLSEDSSTAGIALTNSVADTSDGIDALTLNVTKAQTGVDVKAGSKGVVTLNSDVAVVLNAATTAKSIDASTLR